MATDNQPATPSKAAWWTGVVVSALPVPLLIMSAVMKFMKPDDVVKGFADLGWPITLATPLGIAELVSTVLYVIPQTAVLGAVLLTGYLGGAIATHVRLEESFLIPALLGVAVWLGLFLRDPRVRKLLPWRSCV